MNDEREVSVSDSSDENNTENDADKINTMDNDGHVGSLLAAYTLGVLDSDETASVERHVQSCMACREELASYEGVTGLLPFAAPLHQVPLQARAGLLTRVAELGTDNEEQMIVFPAAPRRRDLRSRVWGGVPRFPRLVGYGLAPAMVLLIAVFVMNERLDEQQQEIAQLQEQKGRSSELLVETGESRPSQLQEFVSSTTASNAEARLFLNDQRNAAMIVARNLPVLGENEHYVVWLIFGETLEHARVGSLNPDEQGRAQTIIEPFGTFDRYQSVLVTLEQETEPVEPTGPEIMTAGIAPGR